MKAIETKWKGYHFRSRLEARWAVFFNHLGLNWQYEPEGFEKDGEKYLPDFRVEFGAKTYWAEVKGDKDWLRNERAKLVNMLGGDPILPNMRNGLIILGDVPDAFHCTLCVLVLTNTHGPVGLDWMMVCGADWPLQEAGNLLRAFRPSAGSGPLEDVPETHLDFDPLTIHTPYGYRGVDAATTAARSARFEHGEAPATEGAN